MLVRKTDIRGTQLKSRVRQYKSKKNRCSGTSFVLVTVMCMSLLAAGCGRVSANEEKKDPDILDTQVIDEKEEKAASSNSDIYEKVTEVEYKKSELDEEWNETDCIQLSFSGNEVQVSGAGVTDHSEDAAEGVSVEGNTVTILAGGDYLLTGYSEQFHLVIQDEKSEDPVHLVFSNLDLTVSETAPIYVKKAKRVVITLAKGTTNKITDARVQTEDEEKAETEQTNVGEKSEVSITGDTSESAEELTAAIYSKSDLAINGSGALVIDANYKDGITSKDDLKLINGKIEIYAVDDGLVGKDLFALHGGVIHIQAGDDGIKATNDGIDKTTGEKTKFDVGAIVLEGGEVTIEAEQDGIQAENGIYISGGNYTINAKDDGIHAEYDLTIDGGTIHVLQSYEALEGKTVTINEGTIELNATDDAINAAGDKTMQGGFGGGMMDADEACVITINGGSIYINASGDGIDSNGYIYVNGGNTFVEGPTDNGNGALDSGIDIVVNGGTLVALGSAGMAEAPGNDSKQRTLVYTTGISNSGRPGNPFGNQGNAGQNTGIAAGSELMIKDASGNTVFLVTTSKSCETAIFSGSAIAEGKEYSFWINGEEIVTICSIQITTWFNSDGETEGASGFGFGGRGNWSGGMQTERPEGFPEGERPEGFTEGFSDGERPEGFPQKGEHPGRIQQETEGQSGDSV